VMLWMPRLPTRRTIAPISTDACGGETRNVFELQQLQTLRKATTSTVAREVSEKASNSCSARPYFLTQKGKSQFGAGFPA
jgi:hypothetical protein